jgi:CheY-like chemotaxis protein
VLGYAPRAWIGHPFGELLEDAGAHGSLMENMGRDIDEGGRWTAQERCVRSDGSSIVVQLFATARVDAVSHAPAGFYLSGFVAAPVRETSVVGVASAGARAAEGDGRRPTPIATARVSKPIPRPVSGETPIVLVADDDPTMRAVVRQLLERGGYDVVETSSGREALDALRNGTRARFLVTDLRMADGSGGWLVSQIGYEFPALVPRTVVISGDASSAAAAHVAARWRCPVLAKPFNGSQLLHTLGRLGERAADVA